MSSWYDRFVKRWANTGIVTDPSDAQANAGFAFLGAAPPSVELFNAMFKWDDEKDNYLFAQISSVVIASGGTMTEANLDALRDAILSLKGLSGTKYYGANGTFTQGVDCPAAIRRIQVHLWGGGGGGAGGINGSGGGGGYTMGYVDLTTGQVIPVTIGAGGIVNAAAGGNTTFAGLTATGGGPGLAGAGGPGVGSGGLVNLSGQFGQDLDATSTYAIGACGFALGGSSPYGGFGGTVNTAGAVAGATPPGGGGGANAFHPTFGAAGAAGGALIRW